ncbi:putative Glutamic acid alanine rich protein of Trypanosoma [Trypanosoma vivax]|nr:putative Glutamic acid alanine rich protein of Trypanosoma [Trypanosoma vivax]
MGRYRKYHGKYKDALALADASNEYTQQTHKSAEQSRQDGQLAEQKTTEAYRQHALEKVAATCELMRQFHGVSADLLPLKGQALVHLDRASSAQDNAREARRIASDITGGGAALAREAAEAASAAEEHADRAEAGGNDAIAAADAEQGNIAGHLAVLSDTMTAAAKDAGEPEPNTSTCGEAAANVTKESMVAAVALYAGFAGSEESTVAAEDADRAVDERDRLRALSMDVAESAASADERAEAAIAKAKEARKLRDDLVEKVAATCELMRQFHGVSADLLPLKGQALVHLDRASSAQDNAREARRIASDITGGGAALAREAAEAASAAEEHADRAEAGGNDAIAAADAEQGNIAGHLAVLSDTMTAAAKDAGEPEPNTSTCGEAAANVTKESMVAAVALYAGFAGSEESTVAAEDADRAVDERDRLRALSMDVAESAASADERAEAAIAKAKEARKLRDDLVEKVAATCELMRQFHGVSADLLPLKGQALVHLDRASSAQDNAREARRIASDITGGGAALAREAAEAASAAEEHADRAEAGGNDAIAAADAEQGNIAGHLAVLSDTMTAAAKDAGEPEPNTSTCGEAAANVTKESMVAAVALYAGFAGSEESTVAAEDADRAVDERDRLRALSMDVAESAASADERAEAAIAKAKEARKLRDDLVEKVAATCELMRQFHGVSADLLPLKGQALVHLDRASSAQDNAREARRIASDITGGGAALAREAAEAASAAEEHADRAEAGGNDAIAAADAEQGNIAGHLAVLSDTMTAAAKDAGEPEPNTSTCGEAAANVTKESMVAAVALYAGFAGSEESTVAAEDADRAVDERDRLRALSMDVAESAASADERAEAAIAKAKEARKLRDDLVEKVAATCELMRQFHGVSADLLPLKGQALVHLDRASSAQDNAREARRIASDITGGGAALAREAAEAASAAEEHADRAEAGGNDAIAAADAEQGNIAGHLAVLSDTMTAAAKDAGEPEPNTSTCGEAAANVTKESMVAAVALYAGFAGSEESTVAAEDADRAVDERDRLRALSMDVAESAASADERAEAAIAKAKEARNASSNFHSNDSFVSESSRSSSTDEPGFSPWLILAIVLPILFLVALCVFLVRRFVFSTASIVAPPVSSVVDHPLQRLGSINSSWHSISCEDSCSDSLSHEAMDASTCVSEPKVD